MKKLLFVEKTKALNYGSFWVIVGLFSVLVVLVFLFIGQFGTVRGNGQELDLSLLNIYEFSVIWHYLTYISGFLHYILALLIIMLATNDIQHGIWRQHIAEGLSRGEIAGAKMLVILALTTTATLFLILVGLLFGFTHSTAAGLSEMTASAEFIAGYFIQLFGYMTMALLFAVVIQKTGMAIILLLLYAIIFEPILAYYVPDGISQYFPMASFSGIIENPYFILLGFEVSDTPFTAAFYKSLAWIPVLFCGIFAWISYKDV